MEELPVYRKIVEDIKDKINIGLYQYKDKLPIESDLMSFYHTSKATIRKALKALVDEGYVYNIYKTGNFVNQPDKKNYILYFDEIDSNIEIDNSEVISVDFTDSKFDDNHVFGNKKTLEIKTVYTSLDIPAIYEIKYILFDKAIPVDIGNLKYQNILNALSQQLRLYNIKKQITISACHASKKVTEYLHVNEDDYVIQVEHYYYDNNNKIVAYYIAYYRTPYLELHAYTR